MPKELTNSYQKLLKDLKLILIQGLHVIEEQRVKTYWQTGELISKHLLENKQHGDGLFIRLSEDLGIKERTLYRSAQFYAAYPNLSTWTNLTWSHYRLLVPVGDKNQRNRLEAQAIKNNWDVLKLKEAIRLERLKSVKPVKLVKPVEPVKLNFVRGKLYTYRLIKPDIINPTESELLVDCGFNVWRDLALLGISSPAEGDLVESKKSGNFYSFQYSEAKSNQLYTYVALIERVVDADTIWVHIDLGFSSWSRQKLRLRGIDAPEISTVKGQKAKEFVEAALSKVGFIIIKSNSLDKYGRPLSDIFYLENEADPQVVLEKGIFLNQQLLDLGLAKII